VESDRVAAAAAELYGADAEAFTEHRKALAAAARAAGDKSAATAIAALRKPTRAAWVVNRLARDDPGAPPRLAAVAAALRAAEQARDGPRLRELSQARGPLIDALTEQALVAAGFSDPPPSLRAEVGATLTAALADPEVGAAFAAGTLTRAVHWSGFGDAGPGPAGDEDPGDDEPVTAPMVVVTPRRGTRPTAPPAARAAAGPAAAGPAAAGPAAAADQRLAREAAEQAAERADRHRKTYEDAERTVASAATAATEALAGEDALEAEVRDLEERLTRARADLSSARLGARRAEAAERRARQALDRLGNAPDPLV
jgi:hypothetical protein